MTLPDISELSLSELLELNQKVREAYKAGLATQKTEAAQVVAEVDAQSVQLELLLGEVGALPDENTIRGVLAFDDQTLIDNAAIALRKSFQGLEALAATTLNLSYLVSRLAKTLD